jgi:hypothetical protein
MKIEPSIAIAIVLGFIGILIILAAYRKRKRKRKRDPCGDDIGWWLNVNEYGGVR